MNEDQAKFVSALDELKNNANSDISKLGSIMERLAAFKDDNDNAISKFANIAKQMQTHTITGMPREFPSPEHPNGMDASYLRMPGSEFHAPSPTPNLLYTRIREVEKPNRAHPTDAGIDFFVPKASAFTSDYIQLLKDRSCNTDPDGVVVSTEEEPSGKTTVTSIKVKPGCHVTLPSGVKVMVPSGMALIFFNKSGVASKKKLSLTACVVDCGYTGEIFLSFMNNSAEVAEVHPGDKITQGVLLPIAIPHDEEILNSQYDDLAKEHISTRGAGGYGSTGTCAC